ncbi:MAG TPA: XdhC family protein [Actinomycetes bacterium]|nr:XdhC family protein [Actinomycetes bacterium]
MSPVPQTSASPATPWVGDAGRSASAAASVVPADLRERVDGLRADRTPFVVATVVRAERPTSAKAGDRALILPDGTLEGFVGGTCAETTVRQYGLLLLSAGASGGRSAAESPAGQSTLLRITPLPSAETGDPAASSVHDTHSHRLQTAAPGTSGGRPHGEGLPAADGVVTVANPCLSGGALEIFLEAVVPPARLHVLGAAPIAQALVRLGSALGYDVAATTDPNAPLSPDTAAVVVATHGRDEEAMLAAALRAAVPYVGLVASRRRSAAVLSALDLSAEERARVRTPAGLDIGAKTAPEIALSILAEIVVTRRNAEAEDTVGADSEAAAQTAAVTPEPAANVDPVCGMTVEASPTSLRYEYEGTVYHFCGAGCRQAFAADPAKYL